MVNIEEIKINNNYYKIVPVKEEYDPCNSCDLKNSCDIDSTLYELCYDVCRNSNNFKLINHETDNRN